MRTYKVKVKQKGVPARVLNVLARHGCEAIEIALKHFAVDAQTAVVAMPI